MFITTKKQESSSGTPPQTKSDLLAQRPIIVAIGASAGGLEAITQIFSNLPHDTGFIFTVIMHFDPNHESYLASILKKVTTMPVSEMRNSMLLRPNNVYVIPPKYDAILTPVGKIKLILRDTSLSTFHLPIDSFFSSLAKVRKSRAIGIVLSGAASDGTMGLHAIKSEGGITLAQKCSSAKYESMPRSAIQSGTVDVVLTPQEIGEELAMISHHPYLKDIVEDVNANDETLVAELNDDWFLNIINVIRQTTNIDFSQYKSGTLHRRTKRRMALLKIKNLEAYAKYLAKNKREVVTLANDYLITTTSFFRDNDVVRTLKKTILCDIVKQHPDCEPIRIWIPACSSGQEAYSLAITIMEYFEKKKISKSIRIFATDISERVLQEARIGFYPDSIRTEVSESRLKKFFEKVNGGYKIQKKLRETCIFSMHNVTQDPPFGKLDLISCRNLLIYFNADLQNKVLSTFHFALNAVGYLQLGCSEALPSSNDLFHYANKKSRILIKNDSIKVKRPELTVTINNNFNVPYFSSITKKHKTNLPQNTSIPIKQSTKTFSPNYDILKSQFETAEEELLTSNEALHSTNKELETSNEELQITKEELQSSNEELTTVNDELNNKNSEVTNLNKSLKNLIVCIDIPIVLVDKEMRISHFTPMASKILSLIPDDVGRPIEDIRPKLKSVNLQKILSDAMQTMEVKDIEVQADDGIWYKLVARPYQSEGTRSLPGVIDGAVISLFDIDALKRASEIIKKTRDDALTIISHMPVPLLVIDSNLRIQRGNEAFYKNFEISPCDTQGENITTLCNGLWNIPALIKRLKTALNENVEFNDIEIEHSFAGTEKFILFSIIRLNLSGSSKGLLLSIQDVTQRKQEEYKALYDKLTLALDAGQIGTWTFDPNLDVFTWDERVNEIWGIKYDTLKGDYAGWLSLVHPEDKKKIDEKFGKFIRHKKHFDEEFRIIRPSGEVRSIHIKAIVVQDNHYPAVMGATWDVTEENQLAQELRNERKKLLHSLKERDLVNHELESFAYIASHDLKAPLRGIQSLTAWIEEDNQNKFTDDSRENFDLLRARVKRMSDLIEGILQYTRAGRVDLDVSTVSVKKLLDEVIDTLNPSKNISIHYSNNLPTFQAAKIQLSQVFSNLISNAIKYGNPQGHIEIDVKDANDFYEFSVKDDGPGIESAYHEKIFEMFQSLQSRDKIESTGIGLSIVKKIVESNHGKVTLESEKDKGATFRFTWPKV